MNRRQSYTPQMATNRTGLWGRPRQFPMLPPLWQIPMLFSAVGSQLGMFGWPRLAMLGLGLNRYTLAFMTGMQKGQAQFSREQEHQMKLHRDAIDQEMEETLQEYERTFREYGDPNNLDAMPAEKQEALKQAIEAIARAKNDNHMLNALHNSGLPGVVNQLNWLDGKHGDVRAGKTAQERKERNDEEDDPYLGTGTKSTGHSPAGVPLESPENPAIESPPAPRTAPTTDPVIDENPAPPDYAPDKPIAPTAPSSGAPQGPADRNIPLSQRQQLPQVAQRGDVMSDAPQPGLGGTQLAQAGADADAGDTDYSKSQVLDDAQRLYPNLRRDIVTQAAEDSLFGNTQNLPRKGSRSGNLIAARKAELERNIQAIIRDRRLDDPDPEKRKQKVLDAVEKISPTAKQYVQGFIEGRYAPSKYTMTRMPWMFALSNKADPTIDQSTFQTRASTLRSFSSGQDGRNMTSIATAYSHLHNYIRDLEELKKFEGENPGMITIAREYFGTTKGLSQLTGLTPEQKALFARLDNEMDTSGTEYERALTGGKPTVTGRGEQVGKMDWRKRDVDAAIADARNKITLLNARMKYQEYRFTAGIGRQPAELKRMFDVYSREGRGAGADELGALPTPDADTAKVVRWMLDHPGVPLPRTTPPPRATGDDTDGATDARAWARSHPNDPRAKDILKELGE